MNRFLTVHADDWTAFRDGSRIFLGRGANYDIVHCTQFRNWHAISSIFYSLPSAMKLRKGIVFAPDCQSFCSEGGVFQHVLGQTPPGQRPPLADTPTPGSHPRANIPLIHTPWVDTPLADTPPPRQPLQRTVHILLDCIPVII